MTNYREILRLHSLGYSQRRIESSVRCSHHTVKQVVEKAREQKITWPLEENVTNEALDALFTGRATSSNEKYAEPEYSYIHKELAKSGVTMTLLWNEYCEKNRSEGRTPYMSTQFGDKYRRWAKMTKATMRIQHKPGDAMQVDWAGTTIPYFDSVTGDESAAYLFVAVLPCSCYVYVEACEDMKTENWLMCHVHAYEYFGGATRLLIPDNLKTGVSANTRYETKLNDSYRELAEHYGTAVVPARVKHPKDKALAERTVRYASTWVIASLRNQRFFSGAEVKAAVSEKLEELNERPFQKREGSRRSAYFTEEKEFMLTLPVYAYEPAVWSQATVGNDYLVSDGRNRYSVPFDLIGEKVQIRVTKNTVEIFFGGSRTASHKRLEITQNQPVVKEEHMPQEHRKYLSFNADEFTEWSASVGGNTSKVVEYFLKSGKAPEQGYKFCVSLVRLGERYGAKRLEGACERMLSLSSAPSIRSISSILKSSQTKPENEPESEEFGITRGAAYFRKGGTRNAR